MNHEQFAGGASEWAALYAAGALPDEQRRTFEAHLMTGCPDCQRELQELGHVVVTLAGALQPATPAPDTRAALLKRIDAPAEPAPAESPLRRVVAESLAAAEPSQALVIRRAAEAAWQVGEMPGVSIRVLFADPDRNHFTALVRMAAGTSYPRHIHRGPEECLVLEGDLRVGDTVLGPGDYQRAPEGSRHGVQSTEQGCLLLITSSLTDEFF